MKKFDESPAFSRSYDLLRWLIPVTQKFPRSQRFVLARALNEAALRLHERLAEAVHGQNSLASLAQADVELTKLRTYLRLSYDLTLLSLGSYEHGTRLVADVGKFVGGWRRRLDSKGHVPLQ
jgi:hypothetical protein